MKQQYHHHRPLYFFLSLCGPYPNRRVQLRNYGDGMDGSAQRENETGVVIFARQSATLVCVLISSSARPLNYNPLSLLRFLSKEVPNCREHPQVKDRLETVPTSKCTRCMCSLWSTRSCLSFAGFPSPSIAIMDNVLLRAEYAASFSVCPWGPELHYLSLAFFAALFWHIYSACP